MNDYGNTKALDASLSRKLITTLKAGTTPIDLVKFLNVGNEKWYKAADEFFSQIEEDNDCFVRFVKGYYGEGKTHFLGMLRSMAFERKWCVSYVNADKTPLNNFDRVYSEIVKNITLPPNVSMLPWLRVDDRKGSMALMALYFSKLYSTVYGSPNRSGIDNMGVLQGMREKVDEFSSRIGVEWMLGSAIKNYIESIMGEDKNRMHDLALWLEGDDVKIREVGITKRINRVSARDILRGISMLVMEAGLSGMLILLDEAERIMSQSRSVRNKSYSVIRDSTDNADNQLGMNSSMIYLAATPDMFDSAKGFAEYDALRSRLESPAAFNFPELIDWRGLIIDLTRTPLPHNALVQLAIKVRNIHAIARDWDSEKLFSDAIFKDIVKTVEQNSYQASKPRVLASFVAIFLEIIHQNPETDFQQIIKRVNEKVSTVVSTETPPDIWE